MTKNFCKLCGARLTPGADICPGCGRWLTPDIPDVTPAAEAAAPRQGENAAPPLNALADRPLQSETELRAGRGAPRADLAQVDPAEVFHSVFGFPEAARNGAPPEDPAAPAVTDAPDAPETSDAQAEGEASPDGSGTPEAPAAPDPSAKPVMPDAPGAEVPPPPADAPGQAPVPTYPPAPEQEPVPAPTQTPSPAQTRSSAPAQSAPQPAAPPQSLPHYAAPAQPAPPTAPVPPHYAPGPGMPPYYPPAPWGYAMPEQPELIPTSGYLAMILIGMIPLAGLVYLIVQAAGNQWRPNRRNFARGFLAVRAILWAVLYLAVFLFGAFAMASGYYY